MHGNSLEAFARYGLPYFQPGMSVLEIGPDPQWLCRSIVERCSVQYHYADIQNHGRADGAFVLMASEYQVDCPDATFDVVFSANVIEHVRKVWRWLPELARITKIGGYVICINPVSWPYHAAPVDCWRLFPEAYKALFDEAGLETVFTWHGNLVPIDRHWLREHGPGLVTDTVAVGRKLRRMGQIGQPAPSIRSDK